MHKEPRSARGQILRGRRFVDGRERREERAAAVAVGDVERAGEALEARRVGVDARREPPRAPAAHGVPPAAEPRVVDLGEREAADRPPPGPRLGAGVIGVRYFF